MNIERMSVIPTDHTVTVNGEAYVCEFDPNPAIHAIQWTGVPGVGRIGGVGHIQDAKGMAHGFEKFDVLEPYLAAWKGARAKKLRADHDALLTQQVSNAGHLANRAQSIEHLTEGLAGLDAAIAENPDDQRLKNNRHVMANDLDRCKAEVAGLERTAATLASNLVVLDERARQAEHEVV